MVVHSLDTVATNAAVVRLVGLVILSGAEEAARINTHFRLLQATLFHAHQAFAAECMCVAQRVYDGWGGMLVDSVLLNRACEARAQVTFNGENRHARID
jgi:hypothetical protein